MARGTNDEAPGGRSEERRIGADWEIERNEVTTQSSGWAKILQVASHEHDGVQRVDDAGRARQE